MNKLSCILKYFFINNLNLNKYVGKNRINKKSKIFFGASIFMLTAIAIFILAAFYTLGLYQGLEHYKIGFMIIPITLLVASIFVLMSTIYKAQGMLFASADYDLLMSMPIKSSTIITAKIINLLSLNYFFVLVVTLPAAIIYFVTSGLSFTYFLIYFILFLFMPLLPTLIASLISFIVSYISTKFKKQNLISTVLSLAIFCAIFFFSYNIQGYIGVMAQNIDASLQVLGTYYPPAVLYMEALIHSNYMSLLIYILINIAALVIFVFALSKSFAYLNTKLKEKAKGKAYKRKELKISRPIFALYKKEIKKYFGTSIYVFNTAFGHILLLAGVILLVFSGNNIIELIKAEPMLFNNIGIMCVAVFSLAMSTSATTQVSFSIEGKNLWISKSMPINIKDIYISKILVGLTLVIPTVLIGSLIIFFAIGIPIVDLILIILVPIIIYIFIALVGLVINLHFPKFDAKSDVVIVKQSLSAFLGSFVPMVVTIGIILLYFVVSFIDPRVYVLLVTAIVVILSGLTWLYLIKKGKKLYEKFDV